MFAGTLHRAHQFRQQVVVRLRNLYQFVRAHYIGVRTRRLHDHFRFRQPFILSGYLITDPGHAVAGPYLAAHVEGLLHLDAAAVYPAEVVSKVDARKQCGLPRGNPVSSQYGQLPHAARIGAVGSGIQCAARQ